MDKETLSNYGWVVIVVIVLAIMIALASPFGNYIADGTKTILKSFSANANIDVDSTELDSGKFVMLDGDNAVINKTAFAPLSFRSSAPYEDFKEVRIDGEVVDGSNYTVKSGSTIVTFNTEYTQELLDGSHTVEIISENGSAKSDFSVSNSNIIPEGGTYYVGVTSGEIHNYSGATAIYRAGDSFPETVNTGDVYVYGDYEYWYNYVRYTSPGISMNKDTALKGWSVSILDQRKEICGEILASINGENIKTLKKTFLDCSSLLEAPAIPNTVTDLYYAFSGCQNLSDISKVVIPDGATDLTRIFERCYKLRDVSCLIIPSSTTTLFEAFMDSGINTLPDMSNATNVINMNWTFGGCYNLKDASGLVIPSSVEKMSYCFKGTGIKIGPDMSKATNVSIFNSTFMYCSSLTTAPDLSNCLSMNKMSQTFYGCSSLTGDITLNANPTTYNQCFNDTINPIKIIGDCSATTKAALAATANNGNVTY